METSLLRLNVQPSVEADTTYRTASLITAIDALHFTVLGQTNVVLQTPHSGRAHFNRSSEVVSPPTNDKGAREAKGVVRVKSSSWFCLVETRFERTAQSGVQPNRSRSETWVRHTCACCKFASDACSLLTQGRTYVLHCSLTNIEKTNRFFLCLPLLYLTPHWKDFTIRSQVHKDILRQGSVLLINLLQETTFCAYLQDDENAAYWEAINTSIAVTTKGLFQSEHHWARNCAWGVATFVRNYYKLKRNLELETCTEF